MTITEEMIPEVLYANSTISWDKVEKKVKSWSVNKYQRLILIVDDQSFNIEALMIILKYSVGVNS